MLHETALLGKKFNNKLKVSILLRGKMSIPGRLPITTIGISETGLLLNRISASAKYT